MQLGSNPRLATQNFKVMRNIFNVLIWNFNTQTIEEYNVIPYFVREWKEEKDKSKFKSFDDIKEFVRSKSL